VPKNEKYAIIADPTYGYLRVDPLPTREEIEAYYQKEFYSTEYPRFNDSQLDVQLREQEFFESRWGAVCSTCLDHFGRIEGLSVFDIGFGYAQALLYFRKRGMRPSGLEPASEGVEYARKNGLQVYQAGIEDFSCVGSERFDVVTLINVLEHLREPAETLTDIRSRLIKPGGLLIIDVPNDFNDFQTAADAEFDLGHWWVCPPGHVNYFSATSLCRLLEKCGYEIYRRESSFPLEIFLTMGDVYVGNPELGRTCHEKRVLFEHLLRKHGKGEKLARFYQLLADLDLGRQVVVYATTGLQS
jgi:2-polyprenyl-3-methyl-5-hydroxy-6-metoxy-1,4-benzoquinol methylase